MAFFTKMKMEKLEKHQRGFFDVRLYGQLADNLVYAGEDCLFAKQGVKVYGRECQNTLFKVVLAESFDEYLKCDLSNDNLFLINTETVFKNGFELKSLKLEKSVEVILLAEKNSVTIDYATKHFSFDGKNLVVTMVYNQEKVTLDYYRLLPDFNRIIKDFRTLMYFDLAARDLEME